MGKCCCHPIIGSFSSSLAYGKVNFVKAQYISSGKETKGINIEDVRKSVQTEFRI